MDLVDRIVYLEHGKIMQVFTPEAFRQLSEDTREQMGLRAIDETIRITAWDAEHIEAAHCNLNEQNAAAL